MYNSINALSSPIYRITAYYESEWLYDIEYICEAEASALLSEEKWRVSRVRYLTGTTTLFDKVYAEGADDSKYNYEKGTAEFCFPATSLAVVSALDFNDA